MELEELELDDDELDELEEAGVAAGFAAGFAAGGFAQRELIPLPSKIRRILPAVSRIQ